MGIDGELHVVLRPERGDELVDVAVGSERVLVSTGCLGERCALFELRDGRRRMLYESESALRHLVDPDGTMYFVRRGRLMRLRRAPIPIAEDVSPPRRGLAIGDRYAYWIVGRSIVRAQL